MARQRDYRAEYQARQARAQRLGYGSYGEQRRARLEGRPTEADQAASRAPRQVFQVGDTWLIQTTPKGGGWGVLERRLDRLDPSATIDVRATIKTPQGSRSVTVSLNVGDAQAHSGGLAGAVAAAYSMLYSDDLDYFDDTGEEGFWGADDVLEASYSYSEGDLGDF